MKFLKVELFNGDGLVVVEFVVELLGDGSGGLLSGDWVFCSFFFFVCFCCLCGYGVRRFLV